MRYPLYSMHLWIMQDTNHFVAPIITILGKYNNWVIMEFNSKSTLEEEFEEVHAVVLDGMAESKVEQIGLEGMALLSQITPK